MKISPNLHRAFEALTEARDRLVLQRRYEDGATFETIALELGLSPERAAQLVARAEKRLARRLLGLPEGTS